MLRGFMYSLLSLGQILTLLAVHWLSFPRKRESSGEGLSGGACESAINRA